MPAGKAEMEAWHVSPGGQVATAVLAANRLGRSAAFVGTVGGDAAADRVLAPLRAAGVDVSRVRRVAGAATQRAMIWVEGTSGERTVFWQRDAGLALAASDAPLDLVPEAGVLLIDGGDPAVAIPSAERARSCGVPVVLDADGAGPQTDALLARCDFPIVSGEWAAARWGSGERAVRALAAGGARLAVATLGADGAVAATPAGEILYSPASAVVAVDTTGAGDVFHGAFCDAVLSGLGPEQALRWSNVAAGLGCTRLGAQGGLPTRPELEAAFAVGSGRAAGRRAER